MDFCPILDKYKPLLKQHWPPILLGLVGLIFLGYGVIALIGSSQSPAGVAFEPANEASESAKTTREEIVIDVEGAVVKPGVYHLSLESRVQDALIAASGLSAEANRNWVVKNLNLAVKLTDGVKIYIPKIGEEVKASNISTTGGMGAISEQSGLININTASVSELDTLKGIGPVTAQKIIDNRPYSSIEDLLNKKVVGQKVFEGIEEKITIN